MSAGTDAVTCWRWLIQFQGSAEKVEVVPGDRCSGGEVTTTGSGMARFVSLHFCFGIWLGAQPMPPRAGLLAQPPVGWRSGRGGLGGTPHSQMG